MFFNLAFDCSLPVYWTLSGSHGEAKNWKHCTVQNLTKTNQMQMNENVFQKLAGAGKVKWGESILTDFFVCVLVNMVIIMHRYHRICLGCQNSSQRVRFGFIETGTLWTLSFLSDRLQVGLERHAEPGHLKLRSNFLQVSEMVTVGKVQGWGKFLLTFCFIYALFDVRFTIVDSLLSVYRAQLFVRSVFMENKLFFPSYVTFWRQFSSSRSLLAKAKLSFGGNGKVLDLLVLFPAGYCVTY